MTERFSGLSNQELTGGKKRIAIVDISSLAESRAKDVAAEKSTEETQKPQGFLNRLKHFGKTVWKRSELKQTLDRYNAEKEIRSSGNLYSDKQAGGNTVSEAQRRDAEIAHKNTVQAITDRFSASRQFEKEFIHTAAGEHRQELTDGSFKNEILGLIKAYARGESQGGISEETFNLEKNKLLDRVKTAAPEAFGKGKMFADNLLEVAKWAKEEVKRQVEQGLQHTLALQKLDEHFEVVVGRAKDAVRTEAQLNAVDKITNFIQKWTGGVLNEASVAVGVAAVYSVAGKAVQGSLKKAAAVFGAGMAVTGAVGAMRESRKLEVERAQHAREMAQGKVFDQDKAERRKEMEESRIGFKKAAHIKREMEVSLFEKLASKEPKDLTRAEFASAMQILADLEARIELSDTGVERKGFLHRKNKYKVDLIGYSDLTKTAQEQTELDIMRAKAKVALKKWTEANGRNFEEDFRIYLADHRDTLLLGEGGVEAKNKIFAELKTQKVRKAFIKSALLSGAFGLAVQEARALMDDETRGLLERGVDFVRNKTHFAAVGEKTTLAEGAVRRAEELFETPGVKLGGTMREVLVGGHKFKLDSGLSFKPDAATTSPNDYYIVDGSGNKISDRLELNSDGSLTTKAKDWLTKHGFNLTETPGGKTLSGIHNLDKAETLKLYPGLSEHPRVDWHDEPGQFWSEIHKKWLEFEGTQQMGYLEKHGDKVYLNISKMADNFLQNIQKQIDASGNTMPGFGEVEGYKDASGNQFVAEKLKHLKEQLQASINDGSFFKRFGAAVIPTEGANKSGLSDLIEGADNKGRIYLGEQWSKMFTDQSQLKDGNLPFRFLEARFDGHTMATAQGFAKEIVSAPVTQITAPEGGGEHLPFVVVPPVPVYRGRRKGLEEMKGSAPDEGTDIVYGGYGRENPELRRIFTERMSPTLRENSQAVLDFENELSWYMQNRVENDQNYLNDLSEIMRQPGIRERMTNECRAVACIPVYTLGEGKGIEHTLEQYRKQVTNGSVKSEEFEVILFLNHPKDKLLQLQSELAAKGQTMDGAEQRVRNGMPEAYDTEEVIKQYKVKHPELKIRVMKKEFEQRPMWGWIIKYAYDAACIRAGARKNPKNKDFLILTNDADLRDMSDKYLRIMIDEFDANEQAFSAGSEVRLDGFVGRIDHDNETYKKWPNFFLASRFDQFLDAQNRYGYKGTEVPYVDPNTGYLVVDKRNGEKQVITQGRNTAIRGSAYCAVGGARVEKDAGADTELGDMVRNGRRGSENLLPKNRNPFKYENKAWLETDPRRELGMYKKGEPVANAWNEWGEMNVYGKSFAEQISGDTEDLNIERLQREFYETSRKWGVSADSQEIQRAAAWLGLAGIETNDDGDPVDAAGNVITDINDDSRYVKYKDYEIAEIEIKNADGSTKKVRGIKILRLDHLNKKLGQWKPKRERLQNMNKEKILPQDLRNSFEQNPTRFIYGTGLGEVKNRKLKINDFVTGLYESYGFTPEQVENIRPVAATIIAPGATTPQKMLMALMQLRLSQNPGVKDIWQRNEPVAYTKWVKDVNRRTLKDALENKTLNDQQINDLAAVYDIRPFELVDVVLRSKPFLMAEVAQRMGLRRGQKIKVEPATLARFESEGRAVIADYASGSIQAPARARRRVGRRR